MIYILRDTPTVVIVTLAQVATLDAPYYLFKIVSNFNESFEPVYVTPTEQSIHLERYNKFTFDIDIPKGEYTYFAYECLDANPTDENDAEGDYLQTDLLIVGSTDDVNTDTYL